MTTATIPTIPGCKTFPARFPGTCDECHQPVKENDMIAWRRGYTAHIDCAPKPSAEDLAAKAAEEARLEAERIAAAKVARKIAKAERETEQARLLAEPTERFGKGYDNKNSVVCGRCGGTGHMPFSAYGGVCFRCNGDGREWVALLKQPRGVKATVETYNEAKVGDIIKHGGTFYRVTSFTWARFKEVFMGPVYNQRVHMERLADGDTHLCVLRGVCDASGNYVQVSDAMRKQVAEQDADGRWIVY